MSLIDDALKRAQGQPTSPPPASGTSYLPPRPSPSQKGQIPNKGLLIVLALASLLVIFYYAWPTSKIVAPPKANAPPISTGSVTSPAASPEEKKPSLFEILSREPEKIGEKTETTTLVTPATEPPTPAEPVMPKLRLDGLILSPSKGNQAMINGVPVRVGDTISGATVQEIDKEHVKLSFQDKDILLTVP